VNIGARGFWPRIDDGASRFEKAPLMSSMMVIATEMKQIARGDSSRATTRVPFVDFERFKAKWEACGRLREDADDAP